MASELARLQKFVTQSFDLEELRALSFELSVNFQDLSGDQKSAKARELILLLARKRRLEELLVALQQANPRAFARSGFSIGPAQADRLYADFAQFSGGDYEEAVIAPTDRQVPNPPPESLVDAASIPLLAQAVDCLFNDCKTLLAARDDGRPDRQVGAEPTSQTLYDETIDNAQAALSLPIEEQLWNAHSSEIEHLLNLLSIQKRNYYQAKEQKEIWGTALVPQHILYNYREAEDGIEDTTRRLQATLAKIYGRHLEIGL